MFIRSRNDIRKLKSEVQYSEKRRLHAEEQEELSSRERAQLRDELMPLRASNNDLIQVFYIIHLLIYVFLRFCTHRLKHDSVTPLSLHLMDYDS